MPAICERFDDLGADGAPCRLGIMGGTFDPIHIGHIVIADEVHDALGLSAVLFIPTGNPVFKKDKQVTDASHRLAMCRMATRPYAHFDTSDIEVVREGDTFTVDTMEALRRHYPENVSFTFIMGTDSANSLPKWRDTKRLSELCDIAIAVRPNYDLDPQVIRKIEAAGFEVSCVHVTGLDVSSSLIRTRASKGRTISGLVPDDVRRYIFTYGLYAPEDTAVRKTAAHNADEPEDPLSEEFYEKRREELRQRVNERRYIHSLGVADMCVQLAETYGYDTRKAALAGILHDWDKAYDDAGITQRVQDLKMEDGLDPWVVARMPRVLHGFTAAKALSQEYPAISADVIDAIRYHTTPSEDMGDLAKIVYIADALEPSRIYGHVDELRSLVGVETLDKLYLAVQRYWISRLFEREFLVHPDTIRVWNSTLESLGD